MGRLLLGTVVALMLILGGCASHPSSAKRSSRQGGAASPAAAAIRLADAVRNNDDAAMGALFAKRRSACPRPSGGFQYGAEGRAGEHVVAKVSRLGPKSWVVVLVTGDGEGRTTGSPVTVVKYDGAYWVC